MDFLYSLYDALVSIQVPADKARAVVDAMERDMSTQLATKNDLRTEASLLRQDLQQQITLALQDMHQEIALVLKDMQLLESRLTVRLGSIMVVGMGVLFAALKMG